MGEGFHDEYQTPTTSIRHDEYQTPYFEYALLRVWARRASGWDEYQTPDEYQTTSIRHPTLSILF